MPIGFECNLAAVPVTLAHAWEHTVGSGRALLALRADWREHLRRAHFELGFRHVRFHGMLDDDMGTLICQNEKLLYSFFNIDSIFDFLLSIGMQPFAELSFMPATLASGNTTVFRFQGNVTPPRDNARWGTLIDRLVRHWVERYGAREVGQWCLEVWNEPNPEAFWTGGKEGYFELYRTTAEVIKNIDANLKVGGSASAQNAWIPEFLAHCDEHRLPVDFLTTHYYPTDAFGKIGADTLTQVEHAPNRAFELLHGLGDCLYAVQGKHGTVDVRVSGDENAVTVFITNYAMPRHEIAAESVRVRLAGGLPPVSAMLSRIDEDHANARRAWLDMGEPEYPNPRQVEALHTASALRLQVHPLRVTGGGIEFDLVMPPQSVAALKIEFRAAGLTPKKGTTP